MTGCQWCNCLTLGIDCYYVKLCIAVRPLVEQAEWYGLWISRHANEIGQPLLNLSVGCGDGYRHYSTHSQRTFLPRKTLKLMKNCKPAGGLASMWSTEADMIIRASGLLCDLLSGNIESRRDIDRGIWVGYNKKKRLTWYAQCRGVGFKDDAGGQWILAS